MRCVLPLTFGFSQQHTQYLDTVTFHLQYRGFEAHFVFQFFLPAPDNATQTEPAKPQQPTTLFRSIPNTVFFIPQSIGHVRFHTWVLPPESNYVGPPSLRALYTICWQSMGMTCLAQNSLVGSHRGRTQLLFHLTLYPMHICLSWT